MKKLTLLVITILGFALASYANNGFAMQQNASKDGIMSVEKAKPHTKQYQDMKKLIDQYEQDVNKASTCEELDDASLELVLGIFSLVDVEYDEDEQLTEQEEKEINEQFEKATQKASQLKEQWGCEDDEEEEEEEEEEVMIELSTEEWESILNDFESIVSQMEKMQSLDFTLDENIDALLEVVMPLQQISESMNHSGTENLTEKQKNRLESINNRLITVATAIGLMDEDDE